MEAKSLLNCLQTLIFYGYLTIVSSQPIEEGTRKIGCQQRSTSGRSYAGEANTTVDGIPCQRWSDTEPHNHNFTDVGDHNFCRNPEGVVAPQVWFHTTDHEVLFQYVSSLLPPSEKLLICCWTMIGKENRASYDNLKTETYLSLDEINMLWLSLVLYTNTDQQQTTRLGENWEGTTSVNVKREVN